MSKITVGELFAGIGGFGIGLESASDDFDIRWQVENDPNCIKVLASHFPEAKRYGDIKEVAVEELEPVDVIVGGFPCQDVSVSGRRKGLAGERSGLWFEFRRVVDGLRPRWVIVENVPGLLSSNSGRDFAVILRGLVELGYGVAWRVLDAQYFGVAQRRRRVFIVGHLDYGTRPVGQEELPDSRGVHGLAAEILFESDGNAWNPAPSRETGQRVTGSLADSSGERGWSSSVDCQMWTEVAEPVTFDWQAGSSGDESFRGKARSWIVDKPGRTRSLTANRTLAVLDGSQESSVDDPEAGPATAFTVHGEYSSAMTSDGEAQVAFETDRARSLDSTGGYATNQGGTIIAFTDVSPTLQAGGSGTERVSRQAVDYQFCIPIAFTSKDDGRDAVEDVAPTLRSMNFDESHLNGGGQIAVAFDPEQAVPNGEDEPNDSAPVVFVQNTRDEVRVFNDDGAITGALSAQPGMKQQNYIAFTERTRKDGRNLETQEEVAYALTNPGSGGRTHSRQIMQNLDVRRLTPVECCRLQGFPDEYLDDLGLSDSTKYRQLGNAVCKNVIVWLGKRLARVHNANPWCGVLPIRWPISEERDQEPESAAFEQLDLSEFPVIEVKADPD